MKRKQLWRCCKCNKIIHEADGIELREEKGKTVVFTMVCSSCKK